MKVLRNLSQTISCCFQLLFFKHFSPASRSFRVHLKFRWRLNAFPATQKLFAMFREDSPRDFCKKICCNFNFFFLTLAAIIMDHLVTPTSTVAHHAIYFSLLHARALGRRNVLERACIMKRVSRVADMDSAIIRARDNLN